MNHFGKQCKDTSINANKPDYICNPTSGRWVKRSGAVGRNILKPLRKRSTTKRSTRRHPTRRSIRRRSIRRHPTRRSIRRHPTRRSLTRRSIRRRSIRRRSSKRSVNSKLVNLSDCHDDTDYLNSMDDLTEFEIKDIVSLKIGNINHCFPKESIVEAMVKGSIIFASPSIRYKVSSVVGDSVIDLAGDQLDNDSIMTLSEDIILGINNFGLENNIFKSLRNILEFYRFYKWPLTSNTVISSQSFDNFIKSKETKFKLEKVCVLKDVSSFTAHGIGAVHGKKDVYDIVPFNKKTIKNRKIVKSGNYEAYYSTPTEYNAFKNKVIINQLNDL
jgi:hypothetical protein